MYFILSWIQVTWYEKYRFVGLTGILERSVPGEPHIQVSIKQCFRYMNRLYDLIRNKHLCNFQGRSRRVSSNVTDLCFITCLFCVCVRVYIRKFYFQMSSPEVSSNYSQQTLSQMLKPWLVFKSIHENSMRKVIFVLYNNFPSLDLMCFVLLAYLCCSNL